MSFHAKSPNHIDMQQFYIPSLTGPSLDPSLSAGRWEGEDRHGQHGILADSAVLDWSVIIMTVPVAGLPARRAPQERRQMCPRSASSTNQQRPNPASCSLWLPSLPPQRWKPRTPALSMWQLLWMQLLSMPLLWRPPLRPTPLLQDLRLSLQRRRHIPAA